MTELRRFQEEMTAFFRKLYVNEDKRLVLGEGCEHARLMLIGEAPGEQETIQNRPFVGKAGKNLDEFLEMSGLDRRALYITNAVKFRPTRISAVGKVVNRSPTLEEIKIYEPWLQREIQLIHPEIVVTMGNVPLKALLGETRKIGECHGQWICWKEKIRLYPLYHPASIIYNPSIKELYKADIIRLGEEMRKND